MLPVLGSVLTNSAFVSIFSDRAVTQTKELAAAQQLARNDRIIDSNWRRAWGRFCFVTVIMAS